MSAYDPMAEVHSLETSVSTDAPWPLGMAPFSCHAIPEQRAWCQVLVTDVISRPRGLTSTLNSYKMKLLRSLSVRLVRTQNSCDRGWERQFTFYGVASRSRVLKAYFLEAYTFFFFFLF